MKTVKAVAQENFFTIVKNRVLYIDLLKAFAIYLVIWGHAILHFQPNYDKSICFNIINSFHMPLFMMLSGYFATSSMALSGKEIASKKIRQLLLPCFSWGILCWFFISSGLIEGRFSLEIGELFTGWLGLIDNFWFLKSCFICYMLAWICKKAVKFQYIAVACTWLICSIQGHFQLSMMFPSFVFGMMLRENTAIDKNLYRFRWLICALFLVLMIYKICLDDNLYIVRLALGISGAYICYSLFRDGDNILKCQHKPSILYRVGEKTLGIYIIQAITLEYLLPRYIHIDNLPITLIVIILPISSILLLLIYYGMCNIIYKSKMLAFLMFGVKCK